MLILWIGYGWRKLAAVSYTHLDVYKRQGRRHHRDDSSQSISYSERWKLRQAELQVLQVVADTKFLRAGGWSWKEDTVSSGDIRIALKVCNPVHTHLPLQSELLKSREVVESDRIECVLLCHVKFKTGSDARPGKRESSLLWPVSYTHLVAAGPATRHSPAANCSVRVRTGSPHKHPTIVLIIVRLMLI